MDNVGKRWINYQCKQFAILQCGLAYSGNSRHHHATKYHELMFLPLRLLNRIVSTMDVRICLLWVSYASPWARLITLPSKSFSFCNANPFLKYPWKCYGHNYRNSLSNCNANHFTQKLKKSSVSYQYWNNPIGEYVATPLNDLHSCNVAVRRDISWKFN